MQNELLREQILVAFASLRARRSQLPPGTGVPAMLSAAEDLLEYVDALSDSELRTALDGLKSAVSLTEGIWLQDGEGWDPVQSASRARLSVERETRKLEAISELGGRRAPKFPSAADRQVDLPMPLVDTLHQTAQLLQTTERGAFLACLELLDQVDVGRLSLLSFPGEVPCYTITLPFAAAGHLARFIKDHSGVRPATATYAAIEAFLTNRLATTAGTGLVNAVVRGERAAYQIERELGHGGLATVYLARRLMDGRRFALKLLGRPRFGITDELVHRFRREATLLEAVKHINVIGIEDTILINERPGMVMEYASGGSLYNVLHEQKPVAIDTVVAWSQYLLAGASAIHQADIIHRDLTPKNVLLRGNGSLAIADFGIARMVEDTTYTNTGDVMGSLLYISAQQRGSPHTALPSDDVFSIGQIMFQLITGILPHGGVGDCRQHRADCPKWLAEFVAYLRAYERRERPRNAIVAERLFKLKRSALSV